MELTNFNIVAALIVGVFFPVYAILYGRKTYQLLTSQPKKKIYIFRLTSIQLLFLMLISLVPLIGTADLDAIGLGFIASPFWVIALFVISFLGLWLLNIVKLTPKNAQKIAQKNARVQFLLPTNAAEYKLMVFVSFIAGICEEIAYRGFLFWFLSDYVPLIPAIILTNLPFALAHLTSTGLQNTIGAFVLGLLFTGAYFLTGSLWFSILLHILVDLYAATFAYKSSRLLIPKINSR